MGAAVISTLAAPSIADTDTGSVLLFDRFFEVDRAVEQYPRVVGLGACSVARTSTFRYGSGSK